MRSFSRHLKFILTPQHFQISFPPRPRFTRTIRSVARSLAMAGLIVSFLFPIRPVLAGAKPPHPTGAFDWPAISSTARPWTYWWWMGNAADEPNIARSIERFSLAGLGGAHIIPIYGARGWEGRALEYLSPAWMQRMQFAVTEAQQRGMGMDMTLGSGWCFGGPTVSDQDANAQPVLKKIQVPDGQTVSEQFDRASLQALMAYPEKGKPLDLKKKINKEGQLNWKAEGGPWTLYALSQKPSSQKVKRAAPGEAGWMLNPFYGDAGKRYLERFTRAFRNNPGPRPRAIYQDSYEYNSSWSPDLLDQFEKRRGYRFQDHVPQFLSTEDDDTVRRLKSDYRETISDLMIERFTPTWTDWARQHDFLSRYEAHGAPANLLDLYAAADIPETEMFAKDRDPLMAKFASSAAHVAGRQLVAAETGTWLSEHFTETLGVLKDLVDELFLSGVNHVFYHGSCYSPDEVPWPGWLFYASAEMNPRNPIWRDVPALNAYIARCQSLLQSGKPDNDLLLYWPIHDFWDTPSGRVQGFTVHANWFRNTPFGDTAQELWKRGYSFDYLSNRQLADTRANKNGIETPGGQYRAVAIPPCRYMPVETIERLFDLAGDGATVIFLGGLPSDVPGLARFEKRREQLARLIDRRLGKQAREKANAGTFPLGKGRVVLGPLETALPQTGIPRESIVEHSGVGVIRRKWDGGRHYFIANRGAESLDGWFALAYQAKALAILNPLTGQTGIGACRPNNTGQTEVYLQLQPGESLFLRTFEKEIAEPGTQDSIWPYRKATGQPVELTGSWKIEFLEGGPELPKPYETVRLASWTQAPDREAERFAGTAWYTLTFDCPADMGTTAWLDLGRVCQSARVRLNGLDLGTAFSPPFRVLAEGLQETGNRLEIEVTSVAANRIRDLDRRKVEWKTFLDINFVNIDYKPFDASNWATTDCGLLGPVRLFAVEGFKP
jgi:hypothetical protein